MSIVRPVTFADGSSFNLSDWGRYPKEEAEKDLRRMQKAVRFAAAYRAGPETLISINGFQDPEKTKKYLDMSGFKYVRLNMVVQGQSTVDIKYEDITDLCMGKDKPMTQLEKEHKHILLQEHMDSKGFRKYRPDHLVTVEGNLTIMGDPKEFKDFLSKVEMVKGALTLRNLKGENLQGLGLTSLITVGKLSIKCCPNLKTLKGLGFDTFRPEAVDEYARLNFIDLPALENVSHLLNRCPVTPATYVSNCPNLLQDALDQQTQQSDRPEAKYKVGEKVEFCSGKGEWEPATISKINQIGAGFFYNVALPLTTLFNISHYALRKPELTRHQDEEAPEEYKVGETVICCFPKKQGALATVIEKRPLGEAFPYLVEYVNPTEDRPTTFWASPEQLMSAPAKREEAPRAKYAIGEKVEYLHSREKGWISAIILTHDLTENPILYMVEHAFRMTEVSEDSDFLRPVQQQKKEKLKEKKVKKPYPFAVSLADARKAVHKLLPVGTKIHMDCPNSPEFLPVESVYLKEWGVLIGGKSFYGPEPSAEYWTSVPEKSFPDHSLRLSRNVWECWKHDYQHAPSRLPSKFWAGFSIMREPPPEEYSALTNYPLLAGRSN